MSMQQANMTEGGYPMVKKFILHLMNAEQGMFNYEINCAGKDQALGIAQGLFPKARVIEIEEVK